MNGISRVFARAPRCVAWRGLALHIIRASGLNYLGKQSQDKKVQPEKPGAYARGHVCQGEARNNALGLGEPDNRF